MKFDNVISYLHDRLFTLITVIKYNTDEIVLYFVHLIHLVIEYTP